MNKGARLLSLSLVAAVIAGLSGCARKPAYSEMDPNGQSRNQNLNRNSEAQSSPSTLPSAGTEAAQPAPATLAPFKSPTFLDQATGGITDLPTYPNARRLNVQLGPVQGFNTMSLAYSSADPMDKISAFYDRVIKEKKWTVTGKTIDPELSEWNLKKGEDDSAKVQVKKDEQTRGFVIVMVRTEKLDAPSK
jgi:hypothetical protein